MKYRVFIIFFAAVQSFCALECQEQALSWYSVEKADKWHEIWGLYKQDTLEYQEKISGWCSQEKAGKMMQLIYDTRPAVCVEIGVFGGSSIYPTAKALKYCNAGIVYAIDPWSNSDCLTGYDVHDPNYGWWNSVDLNKICYDFFEMLKKFDIASYCAIWRTSASHAALHFADESIDILHIDGNHTEDVALADVQLFSPKLKKGGYLWFDDVDWPTTKKALAYINQSNEYTFDKERSTATCFLFQKKS